MDLRADTVVFFLDEERGTGRSVDEGGGVEKVRSVFDRSGEHKSDGMEEAEMSGGELVLSSKGEGCADVAEHHVGTPDLGEGLIEGASNRFFNKRFPGADAEVAGNDLDDVLNVRGAGLAKGATKKRSLVGLRTSVREIVEELSDGGEGKIGIGIVAAEEVGGHVAEIAMLAIGGTETFVGPAGQFGDELGENGAANAERAFVVRSESVSREEAGREGRVSERNGLEVASNQAEFFKFSCRGANRIGKLCEGTHERGRPGWEPNDFSNDRDGEAGGFPGGTARLCYNAGAVRYRGRRRNDV